MPAHRSKNTRKSSSQPVYEQQLTWAEPTDSSDDMPGAYLIEDIEIQPPVTFEAFEYTYSSEEIASKPTRTSHAKKKPEDHVPRPPNAFILFRSAFIKSESVSQKVETNHSTLSKIIGMMWKDLPKEERANWQAKAKAAFEEHRAKFPDYEFKPKGRTPGGGAKPKRKVREVEPKDPKRCAKIAELLVEGLKGRELDAAIKEFDKTHVPEMVMRFDAPITEYEYRDSATPSSPPPTPRKKAPSRQPAKKPIKPRRKNAMVPMSFEAATPELDMSSLRSTPETSYCSSPMFDTEQSIEFDSFILDCDSPISPADASSPFMGQHIQDFKPYNTHAEHLPSSYNATELDFYAPDPSVELTSFPMDNFSWDYCQPNSSSEYQSMQPQHTSFSEQYVSSYGTELSYDFTAVEAPGTGYASLAELELHNSNSNQQQSEFSGFLPNLVHAS